MRHASSGAQFPDKKHKTWKVAAEKHQLQEKTPKNAGLLEPIYTRNKACQSWRAQCLSPTQLIQAPRSKRLPLKSQPNDVWTKRDKHLQTVSFFRSTFVSVSFGLTVHALPVASHSGRMKQVSDSVWFFFKWSCFKKPMCWCMKLWSFINDSFPLLSLSQILKECPFSVNMSTHIPTFLLLFPFGLFPHPQQPTQPPVQKTHPPPSSFTPPWRHVAGSAPCGAYGDAAPCAMAAGFGPLVVIAWHHLC